MIKQENGKWHLYSKDGSKHLGGPYGTKGEAEARECQVNYHKNKALCEFSMTITKASLQPDGSMRWQAVASDTNPDNTGEATSLSLFQDWISRIEKSATVEWLPPPRSPFLGVSHYSSLDGFGEAGITEAMYIDGNRFKPKGSFNDNRLGHALFDTVKSEVDLIKRGGQVETPIRISAAWWDIEHSHGPFIFTRKSLTDVCPMCEKGEGNKVYLKGQLDHFAATRVPINPRTSLVLTERAMTITRKEDAASIIEDELAEELESKSQLVGKSAASLVTKMKKDKMHEEEIDEAEEEMDEEEMGKKKKAHTTIPIEVAPEIDDDIDDEPPKKKPVGGAITMSAARVHPVAKSYTRLELMGLVKRNIATLPEGEQLAALSALVDEVQNEVQQIKEAVEEVWFLQPEETNEVTDMNYLEEFSDKVATALQADGTKEEKAAVIQEALNGLAISLKAELEGPQPAGDMVTALKAALSPLADQIAQLNARLGVVQAPVYQVPTQRSVTTLPAGQQQPQGNTLPVSPITGKESSLTQMVRRSVGLY